MSRDDRRYVLVEREDGGSPLGWFLLGGVLGAGLALLFAPQSGNRTRRLVGRKLGKLRDAADAALDDLRETLSHPANGSLEEGEAEEEGEESGEGEEEAAEAAQADESELESGQEDGRDRVERGPSSRRRVARSARRELEHRLAEARARRQRALADDDEEPVA